MDFKTREHNDMCRSLTECTPSKLHTKIPKLIPAVPSISTFIMTGINNRSPLKNNYIGTLLS